MNYKRVNILNKTNAIYRRQINCMKVEISNQVYVYIEDVQDEYTYL